MKKIDYLIAESFITGSLLIFLLIILNPIRISFTNSLFIVLGIIAIGWFIIFTFFILKENTHDERESMHVKLAGRIAFISGTGVLMVGIFIQSLNNNLDIWLPIALASMMLTKTVSIFYSRFKN